MRVVAARPYVTNGERNERSSARNDGPERARREATTASPNPKVFVGMSGGVDSSVSAALLVEQGYDVTGIYMKNWSRDLPGMKCPWADDLADAKRVAVKLGIPFEVWDFEDAYREKVVEYMLREFKAGNTPNPDIMCNEEIKFKLFYETAMKRGADFIATGHYARVGVEPQNDLSQGVRSLARRGVAREPRGDGSERRAPRETILGSSVSLLRAVDENKDQTYFLYRISDEALAHTLFPIGDMLKPDVKKLAAEKGLHNAYKKESMGVCFVGEVGMRDFLKEYIDIKPGEIREAETERALGYHEGAIFYTIGQRHGLYLSGNKGEANTGLPYYVVRKDLKNNIVYVSRNLNHSAIWTKELRLKDILMRQVVLNDSRPYATNGERNERSSARNDGPERARRESSKKLAISVRLRHRAPLIPAVLQGNTLIFESEIKRPASGQSAVFYDGEICLGGGIIV